MKTLIRIQLAALLFFATIPFAMGQIQPFTRPVQAVTNVFIPIDYSNKAPREINCFRNFEEDITGNSRISAYLLMCLSMKAYSSSLAGFRDETEHWFWDGTIGTAADKPFITLREHPMTTQGYEPNAYFISTSQYIIVAFQGTSHPIPGTFEEWVSANEWAGTNFNAPTISVPGKVMGRVHKGFWESLNLIRPNLDSLLAKYDPSGTKQIWITGHSLGAGHAQLYAHYLMTAGKVPAGRLHAYLFGGPSFVGNQEYANNVNQHKPRFQRFENQSDILTIIFPPPGIYAKAGQRNWMPTTTTYSFNTAERNMDLLTVNSFCDHQPNWYVRALFNQLTSAQRQAAPDADIVGPTNNLPGCNLISTAPPIIEIIWNALANIDAALTTLGENLIADRDGNYKIISARSMNMPKKYLKWNGTKGSQLSVSENATIFTFKKKLTGGYQISAGSGSSKCNLSADVKFDNGLPNGQERTNNIIMRENDQLLGLDNVGDEETWYILTIPLPNGRKGYVFYNWNTKKVMDVENVCAEGGGCLVNEFGQKSNDATQVWFLEKQ